MLPDLPNESGGIVEFDVLGIDLRGGTSRRRSAAGRAAGLRRRGEFGDTARPRERIPGILQGGADEDLRQAAARRGRCQLIVLRQFIFEQ